MATSKQKQDDNSLEKASSADAPLESTSNPSKGSNIEHEQDQGRELETTANPEEVNGDGVESNEVEDEDEDEVTPAHVEAGQQGDDQEEEEEQWDLKHIFSIFQLQSPTPTQCMTKNCPLLACVTYISSLDPESIWHSCIDCQEQDYDGWPETKEEIPVNFITMEHRKIMIEMCTGQYNPAMPAIPIHENGDMEGDAVVELDVAADADHDECAPSVKVPDRASTSASASVSSDASSLDPPSSSVKKAKRKVQTKTPPPSSLKPSSKITAKSMVTPSPILSKSSKVLEDWRKASRRMGGNGKIVVDKTEAKKMIFERSNDAFQPMNITQLYEAFQGVIPNSILKICLTDMTLGNFNAETQFADSDDDDDGDSKPKKKAKLHLPGGEFDGSMICKEGRSVNATLYFVDYKKLFNNGDGMFAEDRNELLSSHEVGKNEFQGLNDRSKGMLGETVQLLSEPTNADLDGIMENLQEEVEGLRGKVEVLCGFKENEKRRKALKKKIDNMSNQWRKRRRITMTFLNMMEDVTEGTISVKKCMKGDGQMDIDSDEAVVTGQIEFLKQKRQRAGIMGRKIVQKKTKKNTRDITGGTECDENFVGVELTSRGVKRVFMEDEEE